MADQGLNVPMSRRYDTNLTVLILHRNRPNFLLDAVKSVRKFLPTVPIIVADNNSKEIPDLTSFRVRIIRSPRNRGNLTRFDVLRKINTDWLLLLDDDVVLVNCDEIRLKRHISNCHIVRFKILNTKGKPAFGNVTVSNIRHVMFGACLVSKSAFAMLGRFCLWPYFGALEAVGAVIWPAAGWQVVYDPAFVAINRCSTGTYTWRKLFGRTFGWLQFFTLFFPIRLLPLMLTRVIVRTFFWGLRASNPLPVLFGAAKYVACLPRILSMRVPLDRDFVRKKWYPDPKYDMFSVPLWKRFLFHLGFGAENR